MNPTFRIWSLPLWECGLKCNFYFENKHTRVTPFVGVWIEISSPQNTRHHPGSLPLWECGLKYVKHAFLKRKEKSLPLWECGLKWIYQYNYGQVLRVTPFVGVWIEIIFYCFYNHGITSSLPLWECGLKSYE